MKVSGEKVVEAIQAIQASIDALYAEVGERPTDAQVRSVAEAFCRMDDDAQAKFFVEVARIMETWGAGKAQTQAWYVGRHLATCECATPEAREFVGMIAGAIERG